MKPLRKLGRTPGKNDTGDKHDDQVPPDGAIRDVATTSDAEKTEDGDGGNAAGKKPADREDPIFSRSRSMDNPYGMGGRGTIYHEPKKTRPPIVIIGAGIAGISAALAAAGQLDKSKDPDREEQKIYLIGSVEGSNTYHAQGGIAAAVFQDDTPRLHAEDTLAAGDGLCDPVAVEILTREGRDRVNELIKAGVHFDRDENGELVRGLEGAHRKKRILHAGGDATGRVVETDIADMVKRNPRIVPMDGIVTRLDFSRTNPKVWLSVPPDVNHGTFGDDESVTADRIILATGGAGRLYPYTTNPRGATGNGVVLALAAGAQVADLEFFQFHPTALAMDENFLVSEAVRGEGAWLVNKKGERYMPAVDSRAELAPRDVVARENYRQMMRQGGSPVFLDARPIADKHPDVPLAQFLEKRFPTIDAYLKKQGIDWSRELVPITPAAHYYMGGVRTDLSGRTSIPGLYAAGECARTGVQGANRLASNSLLEGLVFGHRAGIAAVTDPDGKEWEPRPLNPAEGATCADDDIRDLGELIRATQPGKPTKIKKSRLADPSSEQRMKRLRDTMWGDVGILRDADGLRKAMSDFKELRSEFQSAELPDVDRGYQYELSAYHSAATANRNGAAMALLGFAIAAAALTRTESRGAHARTDCPDADPAQARSRAWVYNAAPPYRARLLAAEREKERERIDGVDQETRRRIHMGHTMLTESAIERAVRAALDEDCPHGDITVQASIDTDATGTAKLVARSNDIVHEDAPGVLSGLDVFAAAFRIQDPRITVRYYPRADGDRFRVGEAIATVTGPVGGILTAERVALNFIQHMSGIATVTSDYVKAAQDAVGWENAPVITDTRKTLPGLRQFEKYAVLCGGGRNHRYSLSDAVMLKDNHLAAMRENGVRDMAAAIRQVRGRISHTMTIEVEVDSLDQIPMALDGGADIIMLDNFTTEDMAKGVAMIGHRAIVEASGGMTLERIPEVARTGVDVISVGALTHSAPAVDFGLDWE